MKANTGGFSMVTTKAVLIQINAALFPPPALAVQLPNPGVPRHPVFTKSVLRSYDLCGKTVWDLLRGKMTIDEDTEVPTELEFVSKNIDKDGNLVTLTFEASMKENKEDYVRGLAGAGWIRHDEVAKKYGIVPVNYSY